MRSLLVANRGEIACRVMRSAKQQGIKTIAVYSTADEHAQHVLQADTAVCIGPALASESYLSVAALIDAALRTGADAIHPGYGFLSENPEFVEACVANNIQFVGPSAAAMRAMGLKDAAKVLMEKAGVPVVPGYHGDNQDAAFLEAQALSIGYPVLIKARAGGGGKGMRRVDEPTEFRASLMSAQREASASFGDAHVLIEKYISHPRHIEVQVFGDSHGNVVHLFERDCSLQRRHQKVIEEAPAPGMSAQVRDAMTQAAVTAARAINYEGAGTIEFIVDGSDGLRVDGFWFMEMNTRLQVEHPVTEAITGVDLVEWQLRVAAGEPLPLSQDKLNIQGHSVEARIYAEDPEAGFLPATGRLQRLDFSDIGRVDSGVVQGDDVLPFYDPLLAKLITHAPDRVSAFNLLAQQLAASTILGTQTNREFLWRLVSDEQVQAGFFDTAFIDQHLQALVAKESQPQLVALACFALIEPAAAAAPAGAPARAPALSVNRAVSAQLGAWQLWGPCHRTATLIVGDSVHTLTAVQVGMTSTSSVWRMCAESLDGFPEAGIEVARLSATRCQIDGVDQAGSVVVDESLVHVQLGPWSDKFGRVIAGAASLAGVADDAIAAPMPGRIVAVHCAVGDDVMAGQALLSMEAMKMEQDLCCTRDGVVEALNVATGDQVAQGLELLRLAAD